MRVAEGKEYDSSIATHIASTRLVFKHGTSDATTTQAADGEVVIEIELPTSTRRDLPATRESYGRSGTSVDGKNEGPEAV